MAENVISASFRTEKGRRKLNEDACLVLTSGDLHSGLDCLLAVADGIGGRASGAVASEMAIAAVKEAVSTGQPNEELSQLLSNAIRKANEAVLREAKRNPELEGMGTTCVAVAVRGDRLCCAHLGDSRAYLLRDGKMIRLTHDHSFVAEKVRTGEMTETEARSSRFRNVITRAIGLESEAFPEIVDSRLEPGDVVLLCTDGLSTPVSDDEIANVLCSSSSADEACERLVSTALRNGGTDNITVIVAAYTAQKPEASDISISSSEKHASWILPAFFGLVIGLILGLVLASSPVPDALQRWREPVKRSEVAVTPDFTSLEYDAPVSLYYVPVQNGILTLDERGYMHVVDLQGRLVRLDTAGRVIHEFPVREQFKPVDQPPVARIVADRQGNLYMSDPKGKRILKYGADGVLLAVIGEGALSSPGALVVDAEGSIYVIDDGRLKAIRPRQKALGHGERSPEEVKR